MWQIFVGIFSVLTKQKQTNIMVPEFVTTVLIQKSHVVMTTITWHSGTTLPVQTQVRPEDIAKYDAVAA